VFGCAPKVVRMLTSLEVTKNADTVEAATAALKEATSKEAVPRLTQPKVEAILINRLRLLDGLPSAEAIMRQLNAGGASMSLVNNIISALASFFTYHRASGVSMLSLYIRPSSHTAIGSHHQRCVRTETEEGHVL
jgi:hypothetical protein